MNCQCANPVCRKEGCQAQKQLDVSLEEAFARQFINQNEQLFEDLAKAEDREVAQRREAKLTGKLPISEHTGENDK